MVRVAVGVFAIACLAAAQPGMGAELIGRSTPGRLNAGLGDLARDPYMNDPAANGEGGVRMFSGPDVRQGDPRAVFTRPPDFSRAAPEIRQALGAWLTRPDAPGGSWSGPQAIPARWAKNAEIAMIYALDAGPAGLENVVIRLGVDNGVFVWLDGTWRFGATAAGGVNPGEYVVRIGTLPPGLHHLQILCADHGGSNGFDISVSADPGPATSGGTAPEPRRK